MKSSTVFFALCLCVSLISCSEKKPEISVGLTYDEVEKALGKPEEITRGVSQLSTQEWSDTISAITNRLKFGDYSAADMKRPEALVDITTDSAAHANGDSLVWLVPMNVQTTGQLLYVTWVYSKARTDTFHVFQKAFGMRTDTLRRKVSVPNGKHLARIDTIYFLDDHRTSPQIYRHANVGDYWGPANNLVSIIGGGEIARYDHYYSKDLYTLHGIRAGIISGAKETGNTRTFMQSRGFSLILKKHIETKKVYETDWTTATKESLRQVRVAKPSVKKYYAVYERYCVTFDASSGRVVTQGYQPILVTDCK